MTTVRHAEWEMYKQQQRAERREDRGVAVTIAEVRHRNPCTCVHSPKKHRKGGGCKRGCGCQAGVR